jgi:predicted secreted protein
MKNVRYRYLVLLALAFPFIALLGTTCSSPTSPDGNVTVTVEYDDFQRKPNYSGTARLLAGGTLIVKLFANTASTGSLWSNPAQLSNPAVFEQTDHVYVPATSSDPGAGGQDVWTFRAIGEGTCSIYTEYKGAFDTVPTWTFTLAVIVM